MVCAVSAQAAERSHMKRADETCFFSPPGRSPRQRDEGASSPNSGNVAPSSDPSGHLLPDGEKKQAASAHSIWDHSALLSARPISIRN